VAGRGGFAPHLDNAWVRKTSFSSSELDETLQSLYGQGRYSEGEELCSDILHAVEPGWETAKLFLLLNFAAQDAEGEALELLGELSDNSLFEAQKLMGFGMETEVEKIVCEGIEYYLSTADRPQPIELGQRQTPSIGRCKALRRVSRKVRENRHPSVSKNL
jgi:hypothetical protein